MEGRVVDGGGKERSRKEGREGREGREGGKEGLDGNVGRGAFFLGNGPSFWG